MEFFLSDLHLSHHSMRAARGFNSTEEMDRTIRQNIYDAVKANDHLYVLGDMGFHDKTVIEFLQELKKRNIKVHLIRGNHDKKFSDTKLLQYCASVQENKLLRNKQHGVHIFLSHYPHVVWPHSFRNSIMLYGHVHRSSFEFLDVEDRMMGKTLNVNVEFNDYKPYSIYDILRIMEKRPNNWDYDLMQKVGKNENKEN